MKHRVTDPLRLDVLAFASDGDELAGEWPGADLERLAEGQTLPQDALPSAVRWRLQGQRLPVAGGEAEIWLHVQAGTRVWLTCQRCMQPYELDLAVDRRLRFVRDEAQAETLDAESEDDVLALPRWLDARELVEDEMLLALPLVPRHELCPQPLPMSAEVSADEAVPDPPNPFAVLQSLKSGRK